MAQRIFTSDGRTIAPVLRMKHLQLNMEEPTNRDAIRSVEVGLEAIEEKLDEILAAIRAYGGKV